MWFTLDTVKADCSHNFWSPFMAKFILKLGIISDGDMVPTGDFFGGIKTIYLARQDPHCHIFLMGTRQKF